LTLAANRNKTRKETGRKYEQEAARFLVKGGYSIIASNWTVGHKEIDLIARKDDTVVFVEVKGSLNKSYGHPAMRVDRRKRHNLLQAAHQFIMSENLQGCDFRFDLITFYNGKLEHYRDAFQEEA
jgi:putative endonuclease